jgi:hypothetical protein
VIPFHIIKAIGYDNAGNNAGVEIEDPKPHSYRQTLPTQPTSTGKINPRNFLLLRYFSYIQLYRSIIHFIFDKM